MSGGRGAGWEGRTGGNGRGVLGAGAWRWDLPFRPPICAHQPRSGAEGEPRTGGDRGGRGGKEDRREPKGSEGSRIPSELKGAEGILREPRGTKRNRRGTEVERGDQKGLGEA